MKVKLSSSQCSGGGGASLEGMTKICILLGYISILLLMFRKHNPRIWKRIFILLLKRSKPHWTNDWLTKAELVKLTRDEAYIETMKGNWVDYRNAIWRENQNLPLYNFVNSFDRQGFLTKRKRENGIDGPNPYEYSLTELGEKKAEMVAKEVWPNGRVRRAMLS